MTNWFRANAENQRFPTQVGSGYTMNELHELDQQLRPHWQAFDTKKPPESVILAPGYKVRMLRKLF